MSDPIEMKNEIARAYEVDPNKALETKPEEQAVASPLPEGVGVREIHQ